MTGVAAVHPSPSFVYCCFTMFPVQNIVPASFDEELPITTSAYDKAYCVVKEAEEAIIHVINDLTNIRTRPYWVIVMETTWDHLVCFIL